MPDALLPSAFAELEPYAQTWCLATETERWNARMASTMPEMHEFYAAFDNAGKETELESLRIGGNEAAFLWRLTMKAADGGTVIEPISVMAVDDDAKITSMRAFWPQR